MSAVLIRCFAVLNVGMFLGGSVLLLQSLAHVHAGGSSIQETSPYFIALFSVRVFVNSVCLVLLLISAGFLWQLQRRGLKICNILFALEIVYFSADPVVAILLWLSEKTLLVDFARSMASTSGIGDMGLVLQYVTGYPLVAIVALNLAYRRMGTQLHDV